MISEPARSYDPRLDDALVIAERGGVVHVTLNRPLVLNALSQDSCLAIHRVLDQNPEKTILINGSGGRAFCAGGDIKSVWYLMRDDQRAVAGTYFRDEYAMNAALFARKAPYIAYLNGLTMGGGYGISAHGSHVVASEATQFAMPEVKIGFFPDVGSVYHLSRAPYEFGTYLALTGNTVAAADMLYAGLAHAHIPLDRFEDFKTALETAAPDDAIARFHAAPDVDGVLKPHRDIIAVCFCFDNVEAILDALKTDGSAFALETAAQMETRSPTSMVTALHHLRHAASDGFATVIARDLVLALAFLNVPDFAEGVRAAVIDKDRKPAWNPATLAALDPAIPGLYLGAGGD